MSVKRRVNWLSQQRVDTPDMRSVESAASNDFDELIQAVLTGTGNGYIMRGFNIAMAGAIGGAASGLQMVVDPGAVMHVNSSQSGTFYLVPSGTPSQQLNSATNTIVDGAFAPSAINYVGLEYERFVDDTTSSQVYLWNPTTNNETTKNAPRAQVLRYRIKISTSIPGSNVMPIATVVTDAGNNVVTIDDARPLFGRLGRGGFSKNPFYQYGWSQGRAENASSSSSNSIDPFFGGDKAIGNIKDLFDALMTSIKEIKGTTYWYSQSSSGSLESLRADLGNTVITGRGQISHSKTTQGLINWDQDIFVRVVGSRLAYKLSANAASTDVTLGDDQVAYVNLVRGVTVSPSLVFTNNSALVTSVGSISWTGPLQAGDFLKVGADTDAGFYQIQSVDSLTQVTLASVYTGASTGVVGTKAKYSFGTYHTSPTPSTSRDIYVAARKDVPEGENVFWLFARSDNGGAIARVYIRFLGSELQQGEDREISDDIPKQILKYIGSPIESAYLPDYVSTVSAGAVPEIADFQFGAASTIPQNAYFFLNSSADARKYYVWFNKDGAGADPQAQGTNAQIPVAITSAMSAQQVAQAVAAALNGLTIKDFTAVQKSSPNTDTVRVTNNSSGNATNAVDYNTGVVITNVQNGVGIGNVIVNDGDNLTLAIKKLDSSYGSLLLALDTPSYDESADITVNKTAGSLLTLPNNSRVGGVAQKYTVGKGILQVFLNGQYQRLGVDWLEVGVTGNASAQIQIGRNLVVGDVIEYRLTGIGGSGGGAGSGGGSQGPQGNPGPAGPAGHDAVGGPVNISTKNGSYTVQLTDNILKGNCAAGSIVFTLPSAASAAGHVFWFKKIDSSANTLTIQAFGSELIDGANTQSLTVLNEGFMAVSDGTTWSLH